MPIQIPYRNWQYSRHSIKSNEHISEITNQSQEDLKEIIQKITSIPVDQRIVSELQSKYLLERQQINHARKYFWVSDDKGNFVFGVPNTVFKKMNAAYDRYQDVIEKDGYYLEN